jgi:hypothetical protein
MRTTFRTALRANVRSPRGAIYPEEVMIAMVEEAQGKVRSKQMLVVTSSDYPQLNLNQTLGVVDRLELGFGWLEMDVLPVNLGNSQSLLAVQDAEKLFSVDPVIKHIRVGLEGLLVVHEARIEHFVLRPVQGS